MAKETRISTKIQAENFIPIERNWTPLLRPTCKFHTSRQLNDLMEFFDHKDNWDKEKVSVGRPWRTDELRLKSNTDLHKLWYVLLKERNMLMTMEAEYYKHNYAFPSPERIDKVEESMEHLIEVVNERDRAYNLLETGETGEPGKRYVFNVLGEGYWKKNKEHFVPMHVQTNWKRDSDLPSTNRYNWAIKFKKLYREKLDAQKMGKERYKTLERQREKRVFEKPQINDS